MKNWMIFFKERTPVAIYILMTTGPVLSGYFLGNTKDFLGGVLSFLGIFSFFIVLRMMDEYKDYHKDVLAHPNRPLPRGLISLKTFNLAINSGIAFLVLLDLLLYFLGYKISFYLYTIVILHLYLMYKEFFVGESLNKYPLIYAITHQLILIPLCLYSVSIFKNQDELSFFHIDYVYAFSVLFSFFAYEVCRKLDPSAHPILKTYRSIYGVDGVFKIVSTLLALQLMNQLFLLRSSWFHIFFYLPIALLFIVTMMLVEDQIEYKKVEAVATLNLLIGLYSGVLYVLAT